MKKTGNMISDALIIRLLMLEWNFIYWKSLMKIVKNFHILLMIWPFLCTTTLIQKSLLILKSQKKKFQNLNLKIWDHNLQFLISSLLAFLKRIKVRRIRLTSWKIRRIWRWTKLLRIFNKHHFSSSKIEAREWIHKNPFKLISNSIHKSHSNTNPS